MSRRPQRPVPTWDLSSLSNLSLNLFWESQWKNNGSPNAPRSRGGGVFRVITRNQEQYLLFIAGRGHGNRCRDDEEAGADAWLCSLKDKTWEHKKLTPPAERFPEIYCFSFQVSESLLYFIPSMHNHSFTLDLDTWTWKVLGSPPGHMGSPGTFALQDGKVCLQAYDKTLVLDIESGTWQREDIVNASDVPWETHDQHWFTLTDNLQVMFRTKYGTAEAYLYHKVEKKWLSLGPDFKCSCLSGGRAHLVGHKLIWINKHDGNWTDGPLDTYICFDFLKPSAGWQDLPITGDSGTHCRCMDQTELSPTGRIYFNGLGVEEDDFLLAELCVQTQGDVDPNWKTLLEEVVTKEMERFQRPVIPDPDPFVSEDIIVNSSLEPLPVEYHWKMASSIQGLFLDSGSVFDPETILHSNIPEVTEKQFYHKNLMHYLTMCYDSHLGVVLTPDQIFYTILCEIATQIREHPDTFRSLFSTEAGGKQKVVVPASDPSQIDFGLLIDQLEKQSPVDVSLFTATFSTTTVASQLAMRAAFLEAMGAYFTYGCTLCGISKIRILGTEADWNALHNKVGGLSQFFSPIDDKKMSHYLKNCELGVTNIYQRRDASHWEQFFSINRCSSGHTDVVEGWATLFFRNCARHERAGVVSYSGTDFYNYDSHISKVEWENFDTGDKFELSTGLFYSTVTEDNFLVPEFSHVICKVPDGYSEVAYFMYFQGLKGEDQDFIRWARTWLEPEREQIILDKGNEVKMDLVLEILEKRIAKEKEDMVNLRELKLDYFNWFVRPFNRYGDRDEPLSPRHVKYVELLSELISINCWSFLNITTELPGEEILYANLGNLTNLSSLHLNDYTPLALEGYAKLIAREECKLPSFINMSWRSKEEWPAELLEAIANRREKFPTLTIESMSTKGQGAQFTKFVMSGKCPLNVNCSFDFSSFEELFRFLAENPDVINLRGTYTFGEKNREELDGLMKTYIGKSTVFRQMIVRNPPPDLASPTATSFSCSDRSPDLSCLQNFPCLNALSLSCSPASIATALETSFASTCLRTIDLSGVETQEGMGTLMEVLAKKGVREFVAWHKKGWGNAIVDALASWISSPDCTLQVLKTGRYDSATTFDPVFTALTTNRSLISVDLRELKPPIPSLECLRAILENPESKIQSFKHSSYYYRLKQPTEEQMKEAEALQEFAKSKEGLKEFSVQVYKITVPEVKKEPVETDKFVVL